MAKAPFQFVSRVSLRVQLTLLMSTLLAGSLAAGYWVSDRVERAALDTVQGYVEMLSRTVQVSVQQFHLGSAEAEANLSSLRARLEPNGLRQISLFDNAGRLIVRIPRDQDLPKLEPGEDPLYRLMDVDIPLVEGGRSLGYVSLRIALTDFKGLFSRMAHSKAALSSLIFVLGFLAILPIAGIVSNSARALEAASRKVAQGELEVELPAGRNREMSRLSATFREMVDKLRAQKELEARLAASEREAAIGRAISGIAHDIRGPLNYVSLAVQQLLSRLEDGEDADLELAELKRGLSLELRGIRQTMADLLDFSRPKIHALQPEDPLPVLRESLEDVRRRHPDAEPRVTPVEPGSIPPIEVDATLLRRALVNVIENAVEASPAPGSVRVGCSAEREGNHVVIWVEDGGPGIPRERLKELFTLYFTTKPSGVGMGLPLASKFVREMGGEILADNLPAGGARFEIRFPAPLGNHHDEHQQP